MANGAIGTRTGADATTTETNSEAEAQKLKRETTTETYNNPVNSNWVEKGNGYRLLLHWRRR